MASMAATEGAVPATVPAASTLMFSAALAVVWMCSARVLSDAAERLGLADRARPAERLATSIAVPAAKLTPPATRHGPPPRVTAASRAIASVASPVYITPSAATFARAISVSARRSQTACRR
jgi:hypothetical protein